MAVIEGWPTDAEEGSVATEAKWRAMARLWAPDGVVKGIATEFAPSFGGGNITVTAGAAWVDGHYCQNLSTAVFTSTSTGLVVARFSAASGSFEVLYRDTATAPLQTTNQWEVPIAKMTAGVFSDVRVYAVPRSIRGQVTGSFAASDNVSLPITFPAGLFTVAPVGVVTPIVNNINVYGLVAVTSTSGATLRAAHRTAGSSISVSVTMGYHFWQSTPTAA